MLDIVDPQLPALDVLLINRNYGQPADNCRISTTHWLCFHNELKISWHFNDISNTSIKKFLQTSEGLSLTVSLKLDSSKGMRPSTQPRVIMCYELLFNEPSNTIQSLSVYLKLLAWSKSLLWAVVAFPPGPPFIEDLLWWGKPKPPKLEEERFCYKVDLWFLLCNVLF